MSGEQAPDADYGSPVEWSRETATSAWRSLKSVYYANTLSWRVLKSGALVFLGFFLWSSSNLLLSYRPEWTVLHYPMAYGFLLIPYGPVHHFVVIPLALRLRRRTDGWSRVGRRLPVSGLALFLAAVLVLGTAPPGAMAVDFRSALAAGGVDVDPDLTCTRATHDGATHVHCHLTESEGIDRVVVVSGGEELAVDADPPFEFTVEARNMEESVGTKQFQVILQDENGATIRRYTRTLESIPEGRLATPGGRPNVLAAWAGGPTLQPGQASSAATAS